MNNLAAKGLTIGGWGVFVRQNTGRRPITYRYSDEAERASY